MTQELSNRNYYGDKTEVEVKYNMASQLIDDFIMRTMEYEREKVRKDLDSWVNTFKHSLRKPLKDMEEQLTKLKQENLELHKLIKEIVKLNNLKMPDKPVLVKQRKNEVKPKDTFNDDVTDDDLDNL